MNRYLYNVPFVIETLQRWEAKDPKSHSLILEKKLPKDKWLAKKYVYCRKMQMIEISTQDLFKSYTFYE